jgi:large subunit ribosomal protein L14e
MVVIADMADGNRVLVDGPGFPRVLYPLKRLTLTRLRLNILRGARSGTIKKAAEKFGLTAKWEQTSAFQKMNRFNIRAQTTDMDRFRVMINRKNRNYQVRELAAAKAKK